MHLARTLLAVALVAAAAGCAGGGEPQVAGLWQRVGQPSEWVEFRADGSFMGRSFMGTDTVRGTFRQAGDSVFTRSTYGYAETLVQHDTVLLMDDGTRFRRVAR